MKVYKLLSGIGLAVALIGFMVGITARFSHPELTETQLLLDYWPAWTATIVGALLYCIGSMAHGDSK